MFEIYNTVFVGIIAWGVPLYKLFLHKKPIRKEITLLVPILYLATILRLCNTTIDEEAYIFPGFLERTVFYILIMHIAVFAISYTYEIILESRNK